MHRREQQKQSHNRHKAQRQSKNNQFGTSNLGEHVDRLLAKAVVVTAQQYRAGRHSAAAIYLVASESTPLDKEG